MASRKRSRKSNKRTTIVAVVPNTEKKPHISNPPPKFEGGIIAWRFSGADKGGPFAWDLLFDNPQRYLDVTRSLFQIEDLAEHELKQKGCHFVETSDFSSEAQARLIELQLDDLDSLYSFRIDSKTRVFAIHRGEYMRILWYDPDHRVYPSHLKHT